MMKNPFVDAGLIAIPTALADAADALESVL
jgi:hypothetical protein